MAKINNIADLKAAIGRLHDTAFYKSDIEYDENTKRFCLMTHEYEWHGKLVQTRTNHVIRKFRLTLLNIEQLVLKEVEPGGFRSLDEDQINAFRSADGVFVIVTLLHEICLKFTKTKGFLEVFDKEGNQ